MQWVMIAAAQWFLYYDIVNDFFCEDSTISNTTLSALVGSNTCSDKKLSKTFGLLPLCSVVYPI